MAEAIIGVCGDGVLMYQSDYPHPGCQFPDSPEVLVRMGPRATRCRPSSPTTPLVTCGSCREMARVPLVDLEALGPEVESATRLLSNQRARRMPLHPARLRTPPACSLPGRTSPGRSAARRPCRGACASSRS